jgi:uncharacterized glyoxalase superfamily protein PhnB
MTQTKRGAQILQIYRESVKPGGAAEYKAVEEDAARYCVELGCPHPHLAIESVAAPSEVWWLNAYESEAQKERVYEGYASNPGLMAALEQTTLRKKDLAETLEEVFARYRPDSSRASPWKVEGARFMVASVTHGQAQLDGYVFEADDGRKFTLQPAATETEAQALARKNAAGETRIFAVRPNWGMPAREWVAADPEFWRPNPLSARVQPRSASAGCVFPNLGYRDARRALRFLVDVLGFQEVVVYEMGSSETIGHAELRWPDGGSVTLHSAEPERSSVTDAAQQAETLGGYPGISIHIQTSDPDALFARVVAAGAAIVRPVEDSPLGTRGFVVRDPEGLYWSFGTPLPKLARDAQGRWQPDA